MVRSQINAEIIRCYQRENSVVLAERLGLNVDNLRRKAARLGVKKIREVITNEIFDGKKLCPKCNKILELKQFNRDKYQPNGYDYWCRACRNESKNKANKTVEVNSLKIESLSSEKKSMAFGVKKNRNPVIWINYNNNVVKGLRCKGCLKEKPLHDFNKLHKHDNNDTEKRKNICKSCIKERRKLNSIYLK